MITVLFQTESRYPINKKQITAAIENFLHDKVESDVEVSIVIVGDRRMRELNNSYRQKDYPTDVLSFPQNDPSQPFTMPFVEPPDEVMHLGDIVVSYPQAVAEAGEENKMVDDMIEFLVLHGLNHLLGNHHPE